MGSSGAPRFHILPNCLAKAMFCLLLGAFLTSLTLAQVPIEPGAPAGDISQLPREVTRTLDGVNLKNGPDDGRSPTRTLDGVNLRNPDDPRSPRKGLQRDGTCLLPPLTSTIAAPTVAAEQLKIPAKATREYEEACAALRSRKLPDAEKHLRTAVQEYGKYAVAWVTLGQLLAAQKRVDEAKLGCAQASSADPAFAPAYLCLADLAARVRDWPEVLKLTEHALELGPTYAVIGYEYNAAANLNLHNLAAAEKSGVRAVEMDRDHREPRVHFVLAQVYEAKHDRENEAQQLREYLKYAVDAADLAIVKAVLLQLVSRPEANTSATTASAKEAVQAREIPRRSWAPADIDEEVPSAQLDVGCPLEQILAETSRRTQGLIESLQRFSADESIAEIDFDKDGKTRKASTEQVNYVAQIENGASGFPRIREYRMGGSANPGSSVVDTGSAVFALIFHPTHIHSFNFRCEGMTHVQGSSAWQLRFEEAPDTTQAFQAIRIGGAMYLPRLKGRAWVASDRYEVLRMETDLASPIPQIGFNLEHLVISYAPVEFKSHAVRLWVPASAALYIAYRGHRYERVHTFNNFHLFSVDSDQTVKDPPSNPPAQFVAIQRLMAEAK
jgi:tetratricopeptide (TPR) repeat protein